MLVLPDLSRGDDCTRLTRVPTLHRHSRHRPVRLQGAQDKASPVQSKYSFSQLCPLLLSDLIRIYVNFEKSDSLRKEVIVFDER